MSHIPSSAMPHAGGPSTTEHKNDGAQQKQQNKSGDSSESTISAQAGKLADYARENPKTVAAAGVAIVGAIAAAAIPLVRGLGSDDTGTKKATTAKKKQSD